MEQNKHKSQDITLQKAYDVYGLKEAMKHSECCCPCSSFHFRLKVLLRQMNFSMNILKR